MSGSDTSVKSYAAAALSPKISIRANGAADAATPSVKRKARSEHISDSPRRSSSSSEESLDSDTLYELSHPIKWSLRKRKSKLLIKSRSLAAPFKEPTSKSVICQTDSKNILVQKLVDKNSELSDQVKTEFRSKQQMSIKLQQEKEINDVLVSTLNEIFDLTDDCIRKNKLRSQVLEATHEVAMKSVLKSPTDMEHFHNKINRDLKTKVLIANSNSKIISRVHNECKDTAAVLKLRKKEFSKVKHPWSNKTGSCNTISQSSSNSSKKSSFKLGFNSILTSKILSSDRIPVSPEIKSLRHSKAVHFSNPLRSFQPNSPMSNIKVSENIEIEIPSDAPFPTVTITSNPPNTQVSEKIQENIHKFREVKREYIDFNLLNVSQSSSTTSQRELSINNILQNRKETAACMARSKVLVAEIDVLNKQWEEFAGTKDDDFDLFDYTSDDEIKSARENDDDLFDYESDESTMKQ